MRKRGLQSSHLRFCSKSSQGLGVPRSFCPGSRRGPFKERVVGREGGPRYRKPGAALAGAFSALSAWLSLPAPCWSGAVDSASPPPPGSLDCAPAGAHHSGLPAAL